MQTAQFMIVELVEIRKQLVYLRDDELHPADEPTYQDEYTRSINCSILIQKSDAQLTECCSQCKSHSMQEIKINNRKKKVLATPASLKAPISLTSPERILLTLRKQRAENEELHKEIVELKEELHHSALPVTKHLHDDLQNIIHELFENCDVRRNISPFMKLFLQEQIKYITESPEQVRYHPMIIKFCLGIHAKSPAAHEQLRLSKDGTGVLIMPSQRTLRDYKNYIRPTRGFNHLIAKELAEKTKNFSSLERFVVISFDEMKIQDDLVWDKHTGELLGFIDQHLRLRLSP